MQKYRWKRQQVRKMLGLIEKRGCIWNTNHNDYHNKKKRQAAFEEIESKLHIPIVELRRKLHNLRAQHSQERSKMNTILSGGEIYITKWEFFSAMNFMYRNTENTNKMDPMDGEKYDAVTAVDDSDGNSNQFEQLSDEEQPESEPLSRLSKQATLFTEPVQLSSTPRPTTRLRRIPGKCIEPQEQTESNSCTAILTQQGQRETKRNSIEMQEQARANPCMTCLTQPKPKDDFSIFGNYVGNELRLLSNSPDLQMKLKYDIQQLILNANYGNLPSQYRSKSQRNSRRVSRPPHPSSSARTLMNQGIQPDWDSGEDDISNDFSIKKSISPHESQDPLCY